MPSATSNNFPFHLSRLGDVERSIAVSMRKPDVEGRRAHRLVNSYNVPRTSWHSVEMHAVAQTEIGNSRLVISFAQFSS